MKHNVNILVAHHKPGLIISAKPYIPVQVGKSLSSVDLGIQGDDTGENISSLNPIFCEMTALYWGWKNLNSDYIGLCHYRRFFTTMRGDLKRLFRYWLIRSVGNILHPGYTYDFTNQIVTDSVEQFKENALVFGKEIEMILEDDDFDMIVPSPYLFSCRNVNQFFDVIGRDHIVRLKEIIKDMNPGFQTCFDKTLSSNKLYAANMFIFKKKLFDDYCKTIFPLLLEHMRRTKSDHWCDDPLTEGCYSRISGYLAETLTSAYIIKNSKDKKLKYVNTMFLNT